MSNDLSIEKRIEELKWYGSPENEGYELFQATCSLCYQMNGIGENEDRCETLYKWAKEFADQSKVWATEDGTLDEVTNGYFG